MPNQIRDYFQLLGVGSSTGDPTIPFDNEFHLLGLDESESDQQIALKAKAVANTRADVVDKRGQAQNKRLDVLLRDKINQAGLHFDGQPAKVAEHREELHRMRERRLKDFAKDLCDSGKWTSKEGADMLETVASTIGVVPARLQKAVSDAVQSAGQWKIDGPPPPPPLPPPAIPPIAGNVVAVGRWTISLWWLILPIGLALALINAWAGLAFGISFLILAWGKANAERRLGGAATTRHLQWGAINAAVASLPLLALLAFGPAAVAPAAKWAGEWDTDWGKMTFAVNSSRVTAQYESRTGGGQADLKTTNERQLDGSWCRGSCAPPNDTGRLRLVLDESGQAFKGWYTNGVDSEVKQGDDPAYQVNGRRKAQQ
jgi:hypothetical protein